MATNDINILIVEDQAIVAMDLSAGLEREGYNIVGIADSAEEALLLFGENEVDIVLMDINIIGEKDGVQTAMDILSIRKVPIIYLTAFTDTVTVNRVKASHPAAFLTKPYTLDNVRVAIELALHSFSQQGTSTLTSAVATKIPAVKSDDKENLLKVNDALFIKQNSRFIKTPLCEILYAEAENNYIHLVTEKRKYTLRMSLQHFEDSVQYNKLIRIHRSYLVNADAIRSFTDTEVQVQTIELPISRTYRESFLQYFHKR